MGKQQNQAASVTWSSMEIAIQANPQKDASLQSSSASSSIAIMPADTSVPWLKGWSEDSSFTITDPLSFALWMSDPLYRVATPMIRRSMEMEEASALINASESAWKAHNGRARGWIRKHLEEDLRLRAGGADPAPDAWDSIRSTKRAALLLDYICIMRSVRVALWWPEQKMVTVVPLQSKTKEVAQINCTSGRMLLGPVGEMKIADWPTFMTANLGEFVWSPPVTVPSIGGQTVAQISERLQTLDTNFVPGGGRTVLWTRLQWLTLTADFAEVLA